MIIFSSFLGASARTNDAIICRTDGFVDVVLVVGTAEFDNNILEFSRRLYVCVDDFFLRAYNKF